MVASLGEHLIGVAVKIRVWGSLFIQMNPAMVSVITSFRLEGNYYRKGPTVLMSWQPNGIRR
jgi:hypothetical protein